MIKITPNIYIKQYHSFAINIQLNYENETRENSSKTKK